MADAELSNILRHLRRMIGAQGPGSLTDTQLLERVVAEHDQAAFEVLVWRHGPTVLGICRRLLRHEQDAEDAFQATFLTLARKAGSLAKREALASWLYKVAYRVALRARMMAAKRALRESLQEDPPEAVAGNQPLQAAIDRERRGVLDEELLRLPEKYRTPLILCYLHGKTHAQAAGELGLPPGSVSRRLDQARELLRRRLTCRGVTLSAGLLSLTLAQETAAAALSNTLVCPTAAAALLFAGGQASAAGEISAAAVTLAQGVLKTMILDRLKTVAALVFLTLAVAGAGLLACRGLLAKPPPAGKGGRPPAAGGPEQPRQASAEQHASDPLPPGATLRLGSVRLRHGARVVALALSSAGKVLASASADRSVRLWDAASGQELRRLLGHPSPVLALALSPDDKVLASAAAQENAVRLWDVATGRELRRLPGQSGPVQCLAFAPDGRTLAVGSQGGTLCLREVATGKEVRRWTTDRRTEARGAETVRLQAVAFSPRGTMLATGGGGTACLWETATGKLLRRLPVRQDLVCAVAFAPDGKTLAVAWTGRVCLFDLPAARELRRLEGHAGGTRSLAFAANGKTLVTGGNDGTVCLWETTTGKRLRRLKGHFGPVGAVVLSRDGKITVSGSDDHTIRFWDTVGGKPILAHTGHRGLTSATAFAPNGRLLATASYDQTVRLWDTSTGKELRRLRGHTGEVTGVVFSADGKQILTVSVDRTIRSWETASGKELRQFRGHQGPIASLALSADGKLLVTGSRDRTLRLWDVPAGTEIRRFGGTQGQIIRVALAPDGKTVASASGDNTIRLWDAATGRAVRLIGQKHGWPLCLAFAPDGQTLATGRDDGLVRLWEVSTGKQVRELRGHHSWVSALAFSPDGKTLASSSYSGALRLWEVATGRQRFLSVGHRAAVWTVAFSADGRLLASVSSDTTALLWDPTGRSLLGPLPKAELAREQLEVCWNDLGGPEAGRAYRALGMLLRVPRQMVPFLRQRLRQAAGPPRERLARLIRELDDDAFAVRQKAVQELGQLGDLAEPALRQALEGNPSAEVQGRVRSLLEALKGKTPSPERLRALRVTEALEHLATPEARKLLAALSRGPPEALLTGEARASSDRLARRAAARP